MAELTGLHVVLRKWTIWMRLQRALTWSVRALALGLALALTLGLAGLLEARLLPSEFLALVGLLAVGTPLLTASAAYLWPISPLRAARAFDHLFHLNERISTALEVSSNERSTSRLLQEQLGDASAAAHRVRPPRDLPLRIRAVEAAPVLVCALLIGLVWFYGAPWFQAATRARAVSQAVAAQEQMIEKTITQIQSAAGLTEQQKQQLSGPLTQALNNLQQNPSLEGSVAILTSTAQELQALSDPQAGKLSQALQQAGQQLASQSGSPLQGMGQQLANGDAVNAASQLKNLDVSKLNAAEAQQLAGQLDSMGQTLAGANPELASSLAGAAQALRSGDQTAAQQALGQAAKEMAQSGQQLDYSQTAGQAAGQMHQGAGKILAAGGGGQGVAPQAAQPGITKNGQANNQPGGAGSGLNGSPSGSPAGGQAGSAPIQQNHGSGSGGESTYEQIYAPSLLGGSPGPSVNLPEAGQSGNVVGQGPVTPANPGQSLVPYSEVYAHYESLNNQAIQGGAVPFEFVQIVKNYFDSLKP